MKISGFLNQLEVLLYLNAIFIYFSTYSVSGVAEELPG